MNKNEKNAEELVEGLEAAATTSVETAEEKESRTRKEQTPEEREVLVAGAEKLKALGVNAEMQNLLILAVDWNADKATQTAAKEAVITAFAGSENLKNFVGDDFQKEILPWLGIAKLIPVLNNIKSFYARRDGATSTKKTKFVQVSISAVMYNVDANYMQEISGLPPAERKALILAHPATNQMEVIEEIL